LAVTGRGDVELLIFVSGVELSRHVAICQRALGLLLARAVTINDDDRVMNRPLA
jgi:hypothetical protein